MLPRVALVSAALVLAGCEADTPTQVVVELRAEAALSAKARSLIVEVRNDEGQVVLNKTKSLEPGAATLARVPLVPKGDDPTRRFTLIARLLDEAGSVVAEHEAKSGYVEKELRELELWFDDACEGVLDCGAGRTCSKGRCVGSCYEPRPSDASGPSLPSCGECQACDSACRNADGASCGCPGETCSAGACVPEIRVSHVDAGSRHTCALLEGGATYCWGATHFTGNIADEKGLLGTGVNGVDSPVPVLVPGVDGREGIALGGAHTCVITAQGRACWGLNFVGELGGPIASIVPDPHAFDDAFDLDFISSGFRHTCGLTLERDLWCWGYNERGNLGLGTTEYEIIDPVMVGNGYTQVSTGGDHTCAVDAEGLLWCWGYNASGEVGVPGAPVITSPIRPGCEPGNAPDRCFDDWKAVGLGSFHSCAIRESGEMYCWGGNLNGQLGIGPPGQSYEATDPQRVEGDRVWADVRGGRSYTCGLDLEGTLYCWGFNEDRQLGIPGVDFVNTPTRVDVEAPGGWRFLGLGQYHGCAVRADRTLWCWGRNSEGQVGVGKATPNPVERPTRVCF